MDVDADSDVDGNVDDDDNVTLQAVDAPSDSSLVKDSWKLCNDSVETINPNHLPVRSPILPKQTLSDHEGSSSGHGSLETNPAIIEGRKYDSRISRPWTVEQNEDQAQDGVQRQIDPRLLDGARDEVDAPWQSANLGRSKSGKEVGQRRMKEEVRRRSIREEGQERKLFSEAQEPIARSTFQDRSSGRMTPSVPNSGRNLDLLSPNAGKQESAAPTDLHTKHVNVQTCQQQYRVEQSDPNQRYMKDFISNGQAPQNHWRRSDMQNRPTQRTPAQPSYQGSVLLLPTSDAGSDESPWIPSSPRKAMVIAQKARDGKSQRRSDISSPQSPIGSMNSETVDPSSPSTPKPSSSTTLPLSPENKFKHNMQNAAQGHSLSQTAQGLRDNFLHDGIGLVDSPRLSAMRKKIDSDLEVTKTSTSQQSLRGRANKETDKHQASSGSGAKGVVPEPGTHPLHPQPSRKQAQELPVPNLTPPIKKDDFKIPVYRTPSPKLQKQPGCFGYCRFWVNKSRQDRLLRQDPVKTLEKLVKEAKQNTEKSQHGSESAQSHASKSHHRRRSLQTSNEDSARSIGRRSDRTPLQKRATSRIDASSSESRYQPTNSQGNPFPISVQKLQKATERRPVHSSPPKTSRSNSPFSTWLRTTVDLSTQHGRAPFGRSRTPGPPSLSHYDSTATSLQGFSAMVEDSHQPRLKRVKSAPTHRFLDESVHRGSFSDRHFRPDFAETGKFSEAPVLSPALRATEDLTRLDKNSQHFRKPPSPGWSSSTSSSTLKAPIPLDLSMIATAKGSGEGQSKTPSSSSGSRENCVNCFGGIFKKNRKPRTTRRDIETSRLGKDTIPADRRNELHNARAVHGVLSEVYESTDRKLRRRSNNPVSNEFPNSILDTSSDDGRPKCSNCFGSRKYHGKKQQKSQNRKGNRAWKRNRKDDHVSLRLWTNPLHGLKLPPNPFSRQASKQHLYNGQTPRSGATWSPSTESDLKDSPRASEPNADISDSQILPEVVRPVHVGMPHQGGGGKTPLASTQIADIQQPPPGHSSQIYTQTSEQSLDIKSDGRSSRWRIPARFQSSQSVLQSSQDVTTSNSKATSSNQSTNHPSQKNHTPPNEHRRRSLTPDNYPAQRRRTIERRGCLGGLCRSRRKQHKKDQLKGQAIPQRQKDQINSQSQKVQAGNQVQKSQAGGQPPNVSLLAEQHQKTTGVAQQFKTPQRNMLPEPMYDMISHYQNSLVPSSNTKTSSSHYESPKRSSGSDLQRIETPNDSSRWRAHYRQYFLDEAQHVNQQKLHTAPDDIRTPNASGSKSPQSAQSAPQLTVTRQKNHFTPETNRLGSLADSSQSEVELGGLQRISASQSSKSKSKDRQEHSSQHDNRRRSAPPSKENTMQYNHENTLSDVSSDPPMSGSTEDSTLFDDRWRDLVRHINHPKGPTKQQENPRPQKTQSTHIRGAAERPSSPPNIPHQRAASTPEMPAEDVKSLIQNFAKLDGSPRSSTKAQKSHSPPILDFSKPDESPRSATKSQKSQRPPILDFSKLDGNPMFGTKSQKSLSPRPNIPLYGGTSPRTSGEHQRKMALYSKLEGNPIKAGLTGVEPTQSPRIRTNSENIGPKGLESDLETKIHQLESPRSESSGGLWSPKSLGLNLGKKTSTLDMVEESPIKPKIISQELESPHAQQSLIRSEEGGKDKPKIDLKGTLLSFKKTSETSEKTEDILKTSETPRYTRLRKASEKSKSRDRGQNTQSHGVVGRPQQFQTCSGDASRVKRKPKRRDQLPGPDSNVPETSKQAADHALKGLLRERYLLRTKSQERSQLSPLSSPRQAFKSLQGSSGESVPEVGVTFNPGRVDSLETPSIVPKSASSSPKSWAINTGKSKSLEGLQGQSPPESSSPKSWALKSGKVHSQEWTHGPFQIPPLSPKAIVLQTGSPQSHVMTQSQSKTSSPNSNKSTLSGQERQIIDMVRRIGKKTGNKQPSKSSQRKGQ